ncbi:MAG: pentapeptide repeat-containing protein, partial [Bacteroidota bacterium]
MKKLLAEILLALKSPMIMFTSLVALTLILVLVVLDVWMQPNYRDIIVEMHGVVFDVFLFGVLLGVYDLVLRRRTEQKREKERQNDLIDRYREEIEDYRSWQSEEAMFRIVGNIKRLSSLDISGIDLCNCFLNKAKLRGVNLTDATLREARLVDADLRHAVLTRADFYAAFLNSADLTKARLDHAQLKTATMVRVNLRDADLFAADLSQ